MSRGRSQLVLDVPQSRQAPGLSIPVNIGAGIRKWGLTVFLILLFLILLGFIIAAEVSIWRRG